MTFTRTHGIASAILATCLSACLGLWLYWPPPLTQPVTPGLAPNVTLKARDVIRFIAVGDIGSQSPIQQQVAQSANTVCTTSGCDFVLLLGDNLYPKGLTHRGDSRLEALIQDSYGAMNLPIYAVLGNHDYGNDHGTQIDWSAGWHQIHWAESQPSFHIPAPAYSFYAGNALFLAVDTTEFFWADASGQREWLHTTLAKDSSAWRIVFAHHPYRSNGEHGNAGTYEGVPGFPYLSGRAVEQLYEEELCGEIDLGLAGHDHSRQWIEACGTSWIISGAGAKTTPLVDRGNSPLFASATEGFVWVELTGDAMNVVFYDAEGLIDFAGSRPKHDDATISPASESSQ